MRVPFSLHKKTGFLSILMNDPLDFRAKLENAEIQKFYARMKVFTVFLFKFSY